MKIFLIGDKNNYMRYKIELRIEKFFNPNSLDDMFTKAIAQKLTDKGFVGGSIPVYQMSDSKEKNLLKLHIGGAIHYFKYISISIMLCDLEFGIIQILNFLEEKDLIFFSTLKIMPPPEYYVKKDKEK